MEPSIRPRPGADPAAPLTSRTLARGEDWGAWEVTCRQGPGDPRFEERHHHVSIAAVLEGSFQYRAAGGEALLYPGAFLLGNAGACFECGHDHGVGDRCVAFGFAPALFEEIAAAAGFSPRGFTIPMLPALPQTARTVVEIAASAAAAPAGAIEDLAIGVAETVLGALSGRGRADAGPASRDQRRVSEVLRFIDAHSGDALDLARLAGMAFMSKYHFLRTFRSVAGVTPYQYLLNARMRASALALRTTTAPIAAIAFNAGFGDLSTFGARFRAAFGMSPGVFRATGRRARSAEA